MCGGRDRIVVGFTTTYVTSATNLSQVADKLYQTMLYTSPWSRFELITSVVIGTGYIGSCKSNYYAITTATHEREIII
jgi:hypothetical protein